MVDSRGCLLQRAHTSFPEFPYINIDIVFLLQAKIDGVSLEYLQRR